MVLHHRIFRHLFVPRRLIAANFAALGRVLFFSYAMQVILHGGFHDRYAFPLYMGSYVRTAAVLVYRAFTPQADFAVRITLFAAVCGRAGGSIMAHAPERCMAGLHGGGARGLTCLLQDIFASGYVQRCAAWIIPSYD